MIELRNSKVVRLPDLPNQRARFSLDCALQALQMREEGKDWEDIKPCLVPDAEGWHVEGAPYLCQIAKDGSRRIVPNRTEPSKYLYLPAVDLFRALPKRQEGNQIIAGSVAFDVIFQFTNTGVQFMVLLKKAPIPFDRILLDMDSAGLDILQLLKAKTGLGIPRPRLIEVGEGQAEVKERWLDWSLKAGRLELGFDLSGLRFPVLLKNTTLDLQVGASADDCHRGKQVDYWNITTNCLQAGYTNAGYIAQGSAARFLNATIPAGSTITLAQLILTNYLTRDQTVVNTRLRAQSNINPATFSTMADFDARTWTVAYVNWDNLPAWSGNIEYTSPDFDACIQEVINLSGWASGNPIVILWDDWECRSTQADERRRLAVSYDYSPAQAPKLHIEYSAGAVGQPYSARVQGVAGMRSWGGS